MTDIVLTLIHGTWAPHAPWTLPDSPLRKALAGQLGDRIAFETLEWSGANTHRARREAAQKLRAQLADSIAANPLARHFLVAHSHGGNVALYAMADATLRQHIAGIAE
jgi:pimeloyl-ACP methyl ester carboxylesterase